MVVPLLLTLTVVAGTLKIQDREMSLVTSGHLCLWNGRYDSEFRKAVLCDIWETINVQSQMQWQITVKHLSLSGVVPVQGRCYWLLTNGK